MQSNLRKRIICFIKMKIRNVIKLYESYSISSNAQTPGLPAASDGQVITKEVNFYSKVGESLDAS